jgi:hypothetical protein
MSDMLIVFAKHIACDKDASEETFLQTSFEQLQALGIQPKKMMAGLKRAFYLPMFARTSIFLEVHEY